MSEIGGIYSPLFQVTLNGIVLQFAAEFTVTRQNSYDIDTFALRCAYSDATSQNQKWFAAQIMTAPAMIAILTVMDGSPFSATFFQGIVDKFAFSPFSGGCTLSGRSMASTLVDDQLTNLQQPFLNQTAAQAVTTLATGSGLTVMATPTTGYIGHYYSSEFTAAITTGQGANRTKWDLMVALAEHEGNALYVDGTTLYFQPFAPDGRFPVQIDTLAGTSSVLDGGPHLEADVKLWRPLKITVQSHHTETAQTATASANATGFGKVLEFKYSKPRFDTAKAQAYADQELIHTEEKRSTLTFRVPHQPTGLTPRTLVPLTGFGAPLDGVYYVRQITTRGDMSGFWDEVECCLTNPLTGAIASAAGGDE